jgi:hypothetical protein
MVVCDGGKRDVKARMTAGKERREGGKGGKKGCLYTFGEV